MKGKNSKKLIFCTPKRLINTYNCLFFHDKGETTMIFRGSVFSTVLEMDTGLTVIAPQDVLAADSRTQVAFLLHGLSANNGSWTESTLLPVYAREYNVVFIMPEVGRSYYFDMHYGQRFFTYVADELPELCARMFKFSPEREDTAVIGVSMGGYGALKCALSRPHRFGWCCALSSGSLYLEEFVTNLFNVGGWKRVEELLGRQRLADLRAILGDDFAVRPEDEIMTLARRTEALPNKPRIYAACGTEDQFHDANLRFRDEMQRLCYDFTYEEWPGEHDSSFFDAGLRKSLRFCFGEGVTRTAL